MKRKKADQQRIVFEEEWYLVLETIALSTEGQLLK